MKRLCLSLFAIASLLISFPVSAASETITDFKSKSSLSADNILTVKETIMVDFAGISHHGIYRTIPIIRRSESDAYYYKFKLNSASENVEEIRRGDNMVLKLGNASKKISGTHQYEIEYTLSPVALKAENGDRVFMNATGQDWEYPILRAQYEINLPAAPISTPVCYAGPAGSQSKNCTVTSSGNSITAVTTSTLAPGSGLSLDSTLPAASFSSYLEKNVQPPQSMSAKIMVLILFGIFILFWLVGISLGIFVIFFLVKLANGSIKESKLKRDQVIVAQYEAPDNLTPAQIGLLTDSHTDILELTATVLDLAIRGYLKIELIQPKTFFKSADYRFTRLKDDSSDLKEYEKNTLNLIFQDGQSPITLKEFSSKIKYSGEAARVISEISTELLTGLQEAGYYVSPPKKFSITPTRLTESGIKKWAMVEGFKLYLNVAEKDRLKFSDAPAKTPELFNKLLPFAVVLSVEKEWASQFEGIDLTQASNWYSGDTGVMSSAVFASTFASNISSGLSSTIGSGSSSGFSGSSRGGSVGGGGGGGGGGGW